jgi:hypothetical protein
MSHLTRHSIGRYKILEPLVSGDKAVVYKAYDTRLDTEMVGIRTENIQGSFPMEREFTASLICLESNFFAF